MNYITPINNTLSILLFGFIVAFGGSQQQADGQSIDISASEFAKIMNQQDIVLLDVRTTREYNQGHLENSILINMYQSDFKQSILALDKQKTYYIYCHSGSRSRSATKFMRKNGFMNAHNIEGGIMSLKRQGITLVR